MLIPNAVGVDIGCGMDFIATNINIKDIRDIQTGNGSLIQSMIGNIMRTIPLNTERYKEPQESKVLDQAKQEMEKYQKDTKLLPLIEDGYFQVGSLDVGAIMIFQCCIIMMAIDLFSKFHNLACMLFNLLFHNRTCLLQHRGSIFKGII